MLTTKEAPTGYSHTVILSALQSLRRPLDLQPNLGLCQGACGRPNAGLGLQLQVVSISLFVLQSRGAPHSSFLCTTSFGTALSQYPA